MVHSAVLFVLAALLLALVGEPLSRLFRLPYASVLVVLGIIAGQMVELFHINTGITYESFTDIVVLVVLPLLVHDAAQAMDLAVMRRSAGIVGALALPGLVLCTTVTGVLLFLGVHHAAFPMVAALLAGALLSATDPFAVVSQLRALNAPQRITTILEGEGVFNDATAIVLFGVLLNVALAQQAPSWLTGVWWFLSVFIGGTLVGLASGGIALLILRVLTGSVEKTLCTIAFAYASYLAAEAMMVSGVMATLACALIVDNALARDSDDRVQAQMHSTWEVIGYTANAVLFLFVGFAFTTNMFETRWLAMLIGIGAVLVARAATVYSFVTLGNFARAEGDRLNFRQQTVLVWGGYRGCITFALALTLPLELSYWFTIQSMAYGVVLFALLVQAPTTPALLRWAMAPQRNAERMPVVP